MMDLQTQPHRMGSQPPFASTLYYYEMLLLKYLVAYIKANVSQRDHDSIFL